MFYGVSNYNLQAMEKTNSCILLFLVFLTSLCNSQDYRYDDYNYDEYDYNNQNPEDYTDNYSQDLNDYYDQNLLVPTNLPLPPPPSPPMGKIAFFSILITYDEDCTTGCPRHFALQHHAPRDLVPMTSCPLINIYTR